MYRNRAAMYYNNNEKHLSANPRRNLTVMLHVLGEQTGMKLSCIKPTSKVRGLSIEPRSSTGCIDLCMYIVRD